MPHPPAMLAALLTAAVLGRLAPAFAGEVVEDRRAGFRFTVPDGFLPNAQLLSADPKASHAFLNGDPNDDEVDVIFLIETLGGLIGRERLDPSHMPPGFQGKLFTARWQGFVVDGIEVPEKLGEIDYVTFNVQVPLKPTAVQVKLGGPRAREAELRKWLDEILAGLDGPTNWKAGSLVGRFTEPQYRAFLLTLGGTIFVVGLVVLWLVSRRAPKGSVLGLAVLIWLAGNTLAKGGTRETLMVGGTLKLLGTTGVLLGLVDLFRKRKRPIGPAEPGLGSGS